MHQVEAQIVQLAEIPRIAREAGKPLVGDWHADQIDHGDVDRSVAPQRLEEQPVVDPAADIEHAACLACRDDVVDDREQASQTLLPKLVGIATDVAFDLQPLQHHTAYCCRTGPVAPADYRGSTLWVLPNMQTR